MREKDTERARESKRHTHTQEREKEGKEGGGSALRLSVDVYGVARKG